jgi:class 3 adenylate cyclase
MSQSGFDYQGFEEARAIKRRRHLRILLPVSVVVIMLLALIAIAIYDYRTMRADALALSKGVITNLQSRIETEVTTYLAPIPGIIRLSRDLISGQNIDGIPPDFTEQLGLGLLGNARQLTAIYIGTSRGEFLMVRRGDSGLETKYIRQKTALPDELEIVLTRRDQENTVLTRQIEPWDQYDPRTRPWYGGARKNGSLYWTDVYPFFTGQTAGITGAVPLMEDDSTLRAVIGADVTLASISRFLGRLSIGKTGLALIVDNQGRVIAHPSEQLLRDNDGKARLTQVADLNDPIVSRAFDRYQVEGHGRRDFTLDGRRYISSASSLNSLIQRDWSVLVVVPEDDFVGFVVDNVSKTLAMGLAVIALAALLAALLIRQGLRADRDAISILEREAQLDAEGRAFGELAAHTGLFRDHEESLTPVSEALVNATRVRRASIWQLQDDTLTCLDCFDRDTHGHTEGMRLTRQKHPDAFDLLTNAIDPVASIDTSADRALNSIGHQYLTPVGCRALLSAPIESDERCTGLLWLEDGSRRDDWPAHTVNFASAIANLLAIRDQVNDKPSLPITPAEPVAGGSASTSVRPSTNPRFSARNADTSLNPRRAEAFRARLLESADDQVIDELAVLSIRFSDAGALAGTSGDGSNQSTLTRVLAEIDHSANDFDIGYLKCFNDQLIASIDPAGHNDLGLGQLTEFALACKAICERQMAHHHSPLAFRIGIDTGPVVGGSLADGTFSFWGEAVQTAGQMADTSLPGAIQVTRPVYLQLQQHYLFQQRGHHYLEGVGEFSTYLLSGRA